MTSKGYTSHFEIEMLKCNTTTLAGMTQACKTNTNLTDKKPKKKYRIKLLNQVNQLTEGTKYILIGGTYCRRPN